MNTAEMTSIISQTEDNEAATIGPLDALPKPAQGAIRSARLRFGLLLGIALLSAWLATTMLNSINELNAEFDRIHAVITLPVR